MPGRPRTRSHPRAPTAPTIHTLLPSDNSAAPDKTIGDFIIEQIKAGVDPAYAAGSAGVTITEFSAWMREGQLVAARLQAGADWRTDFTPEQQDLAVWARDAIRAVSSHVARLAIITEQLARGGLTKTMTRRKTDAAGRLLENHETVETLLPDADMLKWKLEHLAPTVYGRAATLNVNVTDTSDSEDEGELMARRMLEVGRALAIEATSD